MAVTSEQLVKEMTGLTYAQGWDVVCAIDADRVNQLFAHQYVVNVVAGETLPPINGSYPIIRGISVQFAEVTLGSPLISFAPLGQAQHASLSIPFVSGIVHTVQTIGAVSTVLASQIITPSEAFVLEGIVPLSSVQGEVNGTTTHDVVLDISNGESFAADLNLPAGASTILGETIRGFLREHATGWHYPLGTLIFSNNPTELVPTAFEIATQIDSTDPTDRGRLLLFIQTAYADGDETHNPTYLPVPNIIPQVCSATLILSSKALFQKILLPACDTHFSGVQLNASQGSGSSAAWGISGGSGSVNAGEIEAPVDSMTTALTGTAKPGGDGCTREPVLVPLSSLLIGASGDYLSVSLKAKWNQPWVSRQIVPRDGLSYTGVAVLTSAETESASRPAINASTGVISFSGTQGKVSTGFEHTSFLKSFFGNPTNDVGGKIGQPVAAKLGPLLSFPLPQIGTFAVSNLLFPALHTMAFDEVSTPGDLVAFGEVRATTMTISPIAPVLGARATQQFEAVMPGGSKVSATWSIVGPGSINASGLYQAPSRVSRPTTVVVQATALSGGATAKAVVTVVPPGIIISPLLTLLGGGDAPQQFVATVAGSGTHEVTWSISPQLGSIDSNGLYTPPNTLSGPPTAVIATATSKTNSLVTAQASIVLANDDTVTLGVTPAAAPALEPGGAQAFVAGQEVTWSVLPQIGQVTSDGAYTAPAQIEEPQGAYVIATSKTTPPVIGVAAVVLIPATD